VTYKRASEPCRLPACTHYCSEAAFATKQTLYFAFSIIIIIIYGTKTDRCITITIIEFVERRDDRRYRGAGAATLRIRGSKIVSFQMASESKQRVARPDVGRSTVLDSGRSHRESACRQCSL